MSFYLIPREGPMEIKKWMPWNWFEKEEKERSYGSFQRVLSLHEDADQNGVKATFKRGILTISMPRKTMPQSDVRKIEIKSA